MILLADESVDRLIVEELRGAGHTVTYDAELNPGIDDEAVFALAHHTSSVLLTADKDFGELVFLRGRAGAGVVLLRLAGLSSQRKADILLATIEQHAMQLAGAFTVLSPGRTRIRPATGNGR